MASEKQLDLALDVALKNNEAFLAWFVGKLSRGAAYPR